MSTAAVSTPSIYQELQTFYENRQSDLKQLGSALQSGDLNSAQQVYSTLAALGQRGPFANSEPFFKASRAQDFETIGQDLQAGNLAGAQAAFAALTAKQNNPTTSAQTTPAAVVNLTTASSGTNAPPIDNTFSIYQQLQAYRQQRQADLTQLGQDLQAGNLTASQQDFNALTALGQSGPYKDGETFARADRAKDFQAIGQALQEGNLAGAQSAFASLAATFSQHVVLGPPNTPPVTLPPTVLGPPNTPPVTVPPAVLGPPASSPPSDVHLAPSTDSTGVAQSNSGHILSVSA